MSPRPRARANLRTRPQAKSTTPRGAAVAHVDVERVASARADDSLSSSAAPASAARRASAPRAPQRRTPRQRRPSASPSSSPSALPSSTTLAFLRASASAAPAHPARRAGAHSHTSAVAFASPPGFLHRTSSCASAAGGAAAIAPAVPAARQRFGSPARDRSPRRTPHHALPNRAPVVPAALF